MGALGVLPGRDLSGPVGRIAAGAGNQHTLRMRTRKKTPPAKTSTPRTPKLQRWVDLLAALLRRHYPAPFEELAREVPAYSDGSQAHGARMRMFERDKDELRAFGVPIRSVLLPDGETHGYQLTSAEFYLPYLVAAERGTSGRRGVAAPRRVDRYGYRALKTLVFEPEELAAVAEAADRARALGDPTLAADADGAMRKLAFDLPVDAAVPPDAPRLVRGREVVDPVVYERLGDALLRRKRVVFDYHTMERDRRAPRTVEPYGLFYLGSHWYLAGRDTEKDALRNFRVSRIADVRVSAARAQSADFDIPEGFSLRDHARSRQAWELGDAGALEVDVEFLRRSGASAAAARLGEPVGDAGADAGGGTVRRRFRVRRPDVFVRWLLSFAGDARPLSPERVVADYEALRRATLALYAGGRGDG